MIVEAIVAGITSICLGSLIFANAQIKRQRQWDIEDNAPEPEPPKPLPPPKIYPFLHIKEGTPCPKCLRESKNETEDEEGEEVGPEGPRIPYACRNDGACFTENLPHLHCACNTCHYQWLMKPADEKEEEDDDNRLPHPSGTQ